MMGVLWQRARLLMIDSQNDVIFLQRVPNCWSIA